MNLIETVVADRYHELKLQISDRPRQALSVIQTASCPAASTEFADGVIGYRLSSDEDPHPIDRWGRLFVEDIGRLYLPH